MANAGDFQKAAGVSDPTWAPPSAPEDVGPKRVASGFNFARRWPDWITSAEPHEIGSRWRLRQAARIVGPTRRAYPTLTLTSPFGSRDRYFIDAGTTLTLVGKEFPADQDHDLSTYYAYFEGWAMRIYRIDDGPSAGIKLYFSADPVGDRFPASSRLAHATFEPVSGSTVR